MQQRYVFASMGFVTAVLANGMTTTAYMMIYLINPEWTSKIQIMFYWGLLINQIPAGILADLFGGKHLVGFGMISTVVLSILFSLSNNMSSSIRDYSAFFIPFAISLCQGMILPGLTAMMSQWLPRECRTSIGAFIQGGIIFGTFFGTWLFKIVLDYYEWYIMFYVFGILGMVWYAVWLRLVYSNIKDHPFISESEKSYLKTSLEKHIHENPTLINWKGIVASKPLWALVAAQIGHDCCYTILIMYFTPLLEFGDAHFYIAMWACSSVTSLIAEWLIFKKYMTLTKVRKLCVTIGSLIPCLCIFIATQGDSMVTMFMLGFAFLGSGYSSLKVNALDLSPNYAGTVISISNCAGILMAKLVLPYIIDRIPRSNSQSQITFFIGFGVLSLTNLIYVCFGSGEVQKWNDMSGRLRKQQDIENRVDGRILENNSVQ